MRLKENSKHNWPLLYITLQNKYSTISLHVHVHCLYMYVHVHVNVGAHELLNHTVCQHRVHIVIANYQMSKYQIYAQIWSINMCTVTVGWELGMIIVYKYMAINVHICTCICKSVQLSPT